MNEDSKVHGAGAADKAKVVVAILFVIGGLVAYYMLDVEEGWMRWVVLGGALVLGVVMFFWSSYGRELWRFALESRIELRKIVWPNRQETLMTTAVVFGFVAIAGLFFWLLDLGLAAATRALTGQGG